MHPPPPASPRGEVVLARLSETLSRLHAAGVSTSEGRALLAAVTEVPAGRAPIPMLPELAATTARLGRLDVGDPHDGWEIHETVDHITELLRVLGFDMLRLRLGAEPHEALSFVIESLAGVPAAAIEQLVGARQGQLDQWRREGIPQRCLRRVGIAAQVVLELRRSMTSEGIVQWFLGTRAQLDGRTPLDVLGSADAPRLLQLARAPHSVLAR